MKPGKALLDIFKKIDKANEERKKALEIKYGGIVEPEEEFWREREKEEYEDICDLSLNVLSERHAKELRTLDSREKAVDVGIKLMGDHYLHGFHSRRCSSRMAELVGQGTDYMDFYCAGYVYFWNEQERRLKGGSYRLPSAKGGSRKRTKSDKVRRRL